MSACQHAVSRRVPAGPQWGLRLLWVIVYGFMYMWYV